MSREFWIERGAKGSSDLVYEEKVDGLNEDAIHVIEYSAYEALKEQVSDCAALYVGAKEQRLKLNRTNGAIIQALTLLKGVEHPAIQILQKALDN